jgi:hypothetical protein
MGVTETHQVAKQCLLLGAKRTCREPVATSGFDPKSDIA